MMHLSNPRNKGILTALVMIVISFTTYFFLPLDKLFLSRYVIIIVFIAGILWTVSDAKKNNPDADFKFLFNEGFRNFIVVTFLMAIYTFVFYKFFPLPYEYEHFINTNKSELLKQGNRTPDEIEENTRQWKNYFMPLILSIYNFTFLLMGSLITAVLSYTYVKKK